MPHGNAFAPLSFYVPQQGLGDSGSVGPYCVVQNIP